MAIPPLTSSQAGVARQTDPLADLRDAANRTVMNKDFEADVPAPTQVDYKKGLSLTVSQKDQREHGVVSRTAFDVEGQLYIQDTVMKSNGDTQELWKRGKRALHAP